MKRLIVSSILFFIVFAIYAQNVSYDFNSKIEVKKTEKLVESPYSMFGDNTAVLQTKHEDEKDHSLKILIEEDEKQEGVFKLDFQTGVVKMTDREGKLLFQEQLDKEIAARFTTMDPMAEKYYSISPYAYVANNPINAIDLRGDTITTMIDGDSYYWGKVDGKYGFIGSDGALYSGKDKYAKSLTKALNKLRSKNTGRELVDFLANSETRTVDIKDRASNSATTDGNTIYWNDSNKNPYASRPGFIGLGHEMAHTQDQWNGTLDLGIWHTIPGSTKVVRNAEKYATHMENQIRAEHGKSLRTHYYYEPNGKGYAPSAIIDVKSQTSLFYTTEMRYTRNIVDGIISEPTPVSLIYFNYKKR